MALTDFVPFYQAPSATTLEARSLVSDVKAQNAVAKLFKVSTLAMGFTGFGALTGRTSFEVAPYDFNRILKAIDTDSYVRQGVNKYKELMWKEGWDIVSENDDAVAYIKERLDYMELAMGRSFQSLLTDIADQLIKFSNCFIAKARGDLQPFFPERLRKSDKDPIVGYYIIPAETVEIQRNRDNKVVAYRQRMDQNNIAGFGTTTGRQPRWSADDVIHLAVDKKPGRAFGTPFLISMLDDVIALRQMEEDIQNLVHKELFPLYKYTVGTPEHPAEPEEIDQAAVELDNLRNDGGLILPERHNVEVIGAEGASLEADNYLAHFVNRVVVGLGLSPHHLGIMNEGGNRSVTDRLDIALYDKIKNYQRYLADMIRLAIFNELLFEGGYDPFVNPARDTVSDRCEFMFHEIDVDTQVKKENHIIQKWLNNLMSWEETRVALGMDPEDIDEERLQVYMIGKIESEFAEAQARVAASLKPDAAPSSQKGRPNKRNNKSVANKSRPANQHGRRTSPNIRHVDDTWLSDVVETLDEEPETGYTDI